MLRGKRLCMGSVLEEESSREEGENLSRVYHNKVGGGPSRRKEKEDYKGRRNRGWLEKAKLETGGRETVCLKLHLRATGDGGGKVSE